MISSALLLHSTTPPAARAMATPSRRLLLLLLPLLAVAVAVAVAASHPAHEVGVLRLCPVVLPLVVARLEALAGRLTWLDSAAPVAVLHGGG